MRLQGGCWDSSLLPESFMVCPLAPMGLSARSEALRAQAAQAGLGVEADALIQFMRFLGTKAGPATVWVWGTRT